MNDEGITPRHATKAANALNNDGYFYHMIRAFCVHGLGREFYELKSDKGEIDLNEFVSLTMDEIGVLRQLPPRVVRCVIRSAANERPTKNESINAEDFASFALYSLFKGQAKSAQFNWAEIWREVFKGE